MNDNRSYKYSLDSISKRSEYEIIEKWVKKRGKILDLGSGDGTLLYLLKTKKNTVGEGIEISKTGVRSAQKKGISTKIGKIDKKLSYKDKEFDFCICNVTVQMVMFPEVLLSEMVRVSKKQIISFPNFAFFLNRIDLLFNGRMPKPMLFGYEWYSTGHIHQLSIKDFENFCKKNNLKILDKHYFILDRFGPFPKTVLSILPNLWATTAIYLLEEK